MQLSADQLLPLDFALELGALLDARKNCEIDALARACPAFGPPAARAAAFAVEDTLAELVNELADAAVEAFEFERELALDAEAPLECACACACGGSGRSTAQSAKWSDGSVVLRSSIGVVPSTRIDSSSKSRSRTNMRS